jgi:hypothetical protein
VKTYSLRQLYDAVPVAARINGIYLAPSGRSMGIRCAATKGTGKSRLFGRVVLWSDFLQGIPTIVIDPLGGLINEFLDKLSRCTPAQQRALWPRVRNIDMAGTDDDDPERQRVVPFPLYLREAGETPYTVAQRYVDVVARTDPSLSSAPIQGLNAFEKVATDLGMLLVALGWQITEAEAILREPDRFSARIDAAATTPELRGAADFILRDLPAMKKQRGNDWQMQVSAYLRKIAEFSRDPVMRAMFGASVPGLDWAEVVERKQTILLDFSRIEGRKRIQFLMLWVYFSLIRHIKRQGPSKSNPPLSLMIDEITFLLGDPDAKHELLADDLMELTDRISRSHNVWPTVIHQELNQISPRVAQTFMRMGTQIYGSTSDPDAALQVARRFYPYRPHRVKDTNAVYGSSMGSHYEIDERRSYYSIQEQQELNSRTIMEQETFCFLIGISARDGMLATDLRPFTIRHIDQDIYTDRVRVAEAKRRLMARDGQPIARVLAEIDARTGASVAADESGATQRRRRLPSDGS